MTEVLLQDMSAESVATEEINPIGGEPLPPGWRSVRIKDAYQFTSKPRGLNPKDQTIVPFLPMDKIGAGQPEITTYDPRSGSVISSGTYVENGDLLIAKITPSFENGKQGIVTWDKPFGYATTEVIPIKERAGVSNKHYLYFLLLHPHVRSLLAGKMEGATGRQRLTKQVLGNFWIPLPPLNEQAEIASLLNSIQSAIAVYERLIDAGRLLSKTLLHQVYSSGLNSEPLQQTEIGSVPRNWAVLPLQKLAKIGNGSTPKRSNMKYWDQGNLPWLNSSKVHELYIQKASQLITATAVRECHLPLVRANSLVVAITGQGKTLGHAAILMSDAYINQHLAYITFSSESVLPEFILWYFQTKYDYLRSLGRSGGSTKAALTCGDLKKFLVPVPPVNEQHDIVQLFSRLDRQSALRHRKLCALKSLRETLLAKLLSGYNAAPHVKWSSTSNAS